MSCFLLCYGTWRRSQPTGPVEIYQGVIYSCQAVPVPDGTTASAHLVRVDLATPGIQLYLTPEAPEAKVAGFQYRLEYAEQVVKREDLAVVVNGVFFESQRQLRMPGGWARAVQTVIADREMNHLDPHSYLVWFSEDNVPHLETSKPPPKSILRQARWAVGSGLVILQDGRISPSAGYEHDRRTALAIAPDRRLLWLAVFESASGTAVAEMLLAAGARSAVLLDGGDSSTMVLGQEARGVAPGAKVTTWRPSATFVGIRAVPAAPHNESD